VELPYKVGDTVYFVGNTKIIPAGVVSYRKSPHKSVVMTTFDDFTEKDIGETVFLTKEEAEKALKEREDEKLGAE
jgi:hypothetical protein